MFKMDFRQSVNRNSELCRAAIIAIVAVTVSGCATTPGKDSLQTTMQKVGQTLTNGIETIKTRGPSKSSRQANDALAVVSKYPLDQVPHTLMKKPVADGRLTSGHGYRLSPTGVPLPRKHKGVDYAAPTGTPVYAAGAGTIIKHYTSKSYGNYIKIEHANGFFTAYAHMQAFADGLGVGSQVSRGQMIGNVGSTGRSSGPHLHFELLYGSKPIDPLFESLPPVQSAAY